MSRSGLEVYFGKTGGLKILDLSYLILWSCYSELDLGIYLIRLFFETIWISCSDLLWCIKHLLLPIICELPLLEVKPFIRLPFFVLFMEVKGRLVLDLNMWEALKFYCVPALFMTNYVLSDYWNLFNSSFSIS